MMMILRKNGWFESPLRQTSQLSLSKIATALNNGVLRHNSHEREHRCNYIDLYINNTTPATASWWVRQSAVSKVVGGGIFGCFFELR